MTKVLLIGSEDIGQTLLDGWLTRGAASREIVVVGHGSPLRARAPSVRVVEEVPSGFLPDAVVLAVDPAASHEALSRCSSSETAVFVSVIPGVTLADLSAGLKPGSAVVRAMPNAPARVGCGMTVAVANATVTAGQKKICDELFDAVGQIVWVEDEALMDVVSAVSGAGPAYVFLLTETLATAGVAAGLPGALASHLAKATVVGAGELLRQSGESPAQLRKDVTTPGGTCSAALEFLMGKDGLPSMMDKAVAAAVKGAKHQPDAS